ncbi:uncharacterized protein EKO05_0009053 [Ascochyta rabiei]|uniref:uncharacterized protein n=1 Tax=Didymella rabiei TaxID=5454 RepID=UPI0021F983B9|nr:uncharacterized protein EKO05_0009053 [Ascochyta rabiei]UPX18762.1 hypothetical protein EKO05_0009053 [Ascochyta rabiei]
MHGLFGRLKLWSMLSPYKLSDGSFTQMLSNGDIDAYGAYRKFSTPSKAGFLPSSASSF